MTANDEAFIVEFDRVTTMIRKLGYLYCDELRTAEEQVTLEEIVTVLTHYGLLPDWPIVPRKIT